MIGSEKQMRWAEEVRAAKNFNELRRRAEQTQNARAIKAIDYIEALDHASCWIDYRSSSAGEMLNALCTTGLMIRGREYSHRAIMDATGIITVTHNHEESDGKGGLITTVITETR